MRWLALLLLGTGVLTLAWSAALHYAHSRRSELTPVSHYLMGTALWTVVVLLLFVTNLVWSWPPWWVASASFGALCTGAGAARVWLFLHRKG